MSGAGAGPADGSRDRQPHPAIDAGVGCAAGYDGAKRRKGSKVHIAVDTLGHLLALTVTPADQGDREQVAALAEEVQQVTGNKVELAYVDQGYTGPNAAAAAEQHGLRLEVVNHPMAKRGFVLLPRRWVGRLGSTLPPPRQRLRTPRHHPQRISPARLSPPSCSVTSPLFSSEVPNRL